MLRQRFRMQTWKKCTCHKPQGAELPHGYCLKLKKSLYGLKQAPRNWHKTVLGTVLRMGYQQSKLDNCLFFKNDDKGLHLIVLYVDDIIIISGDEEECRRVKLGFKKEYVIQDLGTLKHYLGITIEDQEESVVAHQRSYSVSILERFAHLLPKSSRIVKGDGEESEDTTASWLQTVQNGQGIRDACSVTICFKVSISTGGWCANVPWG